MNYLVVDGPSYRTSYPVSLYRGTDRKEPTYCDSVPDGDEINQLFRWYVAQVGAVHDLAKARRYAALCNMYFPGQYFEVVEVTKGDTAPTSDRQFLGFDISLGGCGDSLIFTSLLAGPSASIPEEPILILSDLIRRYFTPRLNQFGLFQTFDDATYCRKVMIALQSFHPGLYEGGSLDVFEVAGIHLVSDG
jgi:hypothetical protein